MIRLVVWIVGVGVTILLALFGAFGAVAAFSHSPESQSGFLGERNQYPWSLLSW